jgi:hypothetical protein
MSLLSGLLGGSYIGVVKKYIDKIFIHEANLHNHSDADFDIILRKVNGNMRIFIYSRKTQTLLRELPDKEAEEILTS